jgi:hypothetical protein
MFCIIKIPENPVLLLLSCKKIKDYLFPSHSKRKDPLRSWCFKSTSEIAISEQIIAIIVIINDRLSL